MTAKNKRSFFKRIVDVTVLLIILMISMPGVSVQGSQNKIVNLQINSKAIQIVETMTAREKIGQLFLLTFKGTDVTEGSAIEQLITNYHIGGVILTAGNDNFEDTGNLAQATNQIITQLQQESWNTSQFDHTDPVTGKIYRPNYIPLLVGISQEGDGPPYDQILSGLTRMPNLMTIGATWSPQFSEQAGEVVGKELSSIGFNLFLGPSLDVLESPDPESGKSLSTRAFGGDPSWVSSLGQAYIQGIHNGSNHRLAVVAKHFPGHGSSDRLPEEEVATIRRSLNDLQEFDLIPFFSVTGDAPTPDVRADALLVSHIRFQGFMGSSPRASTRPINLDQDALRLLMEFPSIQEWRQEGGVFISDDLGGNAIRGYLDLSSQDFSPQRVTLSAILAGNDMLYISDFSVQDQPDSLTEKINTIEYLIQKYTEDPAFAQRVDESVLRIIDLKTKIYPDFTTEEVLPNNFTPDAIIEDTNIPFDIIRNSATLINPAQSDLDQLLPNPPQRTDRIVFVTDSRPYQQCSKCPIESEIPRDALEKVVLQRYGPNAGRLVVNANLNSVTIQDLENLLNNREGAEETQRKLALSHWIIFAMLDNNEDYPSYTILSRFLARRPDLLQGKRLIVFAFNAPYYLDATDISKITAYYGLYSKIPQAIDMAAYILFQELPITGDLPVSVPGVGYSLNEALFPDPNQLITIEFDYPEDNQAEIVSTGTPQPLPILQIGDIVPIRTGVILDQNGHVVPDGTPVEFTLNTGLDTSPIRQNEFTQQGIARTSFIIPSGGPIEIKAQSEQAVSLPIRLDIPIPLVEEETDTPTPEPTATATETLTPTATPEPTPIPVVIIPPKPEITDWIIAVLLISLVSWVSYRLAIFAGQEKWASRFGLLILLGGVTAYSYLVLQLPGSQALLDQSVSQAVIVITLIGGFIGFILALSWRVIARRTA